MDKSESTPNNHQSHLRQKWESFQQQIQATTKRIKEMDVQTEAKIAEIQQDTERYKQKVTEHTEDQLKQMNLIGEKLKLGLEEKDPAFVQSQIEAMLSLLEEKPDIQQEIDDSKLKSANRIARRPLSALIFFWGGLANH